jgi:uncharacterized YccA/Bax inhibitor family protein
VLLLFFAAHIVVGLQTTLNSSCKLGIVFFLFFLVFAPFSNFLCNRKKKFDMKNKRITQKNIM